jgi:hypothetical protein
MNNLGCLRSGGGYENNDLYLAIDSQNCQHFTMRRMRTCRVRKLREQWNWHIPSVKPVLPSVFRRVWFIWLRRSDPGFIVQSSNDHHAILFSRSAL